MIENIPILWFAVMALAVLDIICLIGLIVLSAKIKRFKVAYIALQTFATGRKLDEMLDGYMDKVRFLERALEECQSRLSAIEKRQSLSVDRAELLRFNAFENMGSDLSFALALLNEKGDGVVLSSIHNREESRVYAKPVLNGESGYPLGEEERQVIGKAMSR